MLLSLILREFLVFLSCLFFFSVLWDMRVGLFSVGIGIVIGISRLML